MIAIIDYGMGNVNSILNMIKKIGYKAFITSSHDEISKSSFLILPGVGSFDNGIKKLCETGLYSLIKDLVKNKNKPFLGICLGMQLLFSLSEEGKERGLNIIEGSVKKFSFKNNQIKVPHMGWNSIKPCVNTSLFKNIDIEDKFYFAHSYYAECENLEDCISHTDYGLTFCSSVKKGNVYGVQFHPEKSNKNGMKLLNNFLRIK